jgi:hypothetical protein
MIAQNNTKLNFIFCGGWSLTSIFLSQKELKNKRATSGIIRDHQQYPLVL